MQPNHVFAIDIVLLLPPDVMELCVQWKRKSALGKTLPFFLNTTDRLPHVTLLQGFILETSVPIFSDTLEQISRTTKELPLTICELAEERPKHFVLKIKNTSAVQELHELIFQKCSSMCLSKGDPTNSYILDPHEKRTGENPYAWTRDFLHEHSHTEYDPHITLGDAHGRPIVSLPLHFTASTLALCHMGTSGT